MKTPRFRNLALRWAMLGGVLVLMQPVFSQPVRAQRLVAAVEPSGAVAAHAAPSSDALPVSPTPHNSQALSTIHIPQSLPKKPMPMASVERTPPTRTWVILSLAQHSAAAFDAYSTRYAILQGAQETNPFLRPFAHSAGIYAAIQVVPVGLDFVARRMQRSPRGYLRHMWWAPQTAGTAASIFSGVHNLNVECRP